MTEKVQQITAQNFIRLGIAAFKEHELREIVATFCKLPGIAPAVAATAGWQPIAAAPRDGTRLLGTGGGLEDTVEMISYNERVAAWDTENYTLDDRDDEAEGYNRPSHWMPLPSPHSRPQRGPAT